MSNINEISWRSRKGQFRHCQYSRAVLPSALWICGETSRWELNNGVCLPDVLERQGVWRPLP